MGTGIGKRIKKIRLEKGMTQIELANRLGFTNKSTISKVESGIEDNMTIDRIEKYADALDCSPAYLVGWETFDFFNDTSSVALAIRYFDASPKQKELICKMFDVIINSNID